ncbi:MAG TPA: hypothetical protein VF618_09035 [Thermoanaerobaculia bacterium]
MTLLKFHTSFTGKLRDVVLPVQIHTHDLTLVQQAMTSESVDLAPGMYVVTALMPSGHEITRVVPLENEATTVELSAPKGAELEEAKYLDSPRAILAEVRSKAAPKAKPPTKRGFGLTNSKRGAVSSSAAQPSLLTLFAGNPLRGTAQKSDPAFQKIAEAENVTQYRVEPSTQLRFVQVRQDGRPAVNIALPTSEHAGCTIAAHREPDRVWVEVQVEHADAALLLGYQQSRSSHQEPPLAERLLGKKYEPSVGPIAAAIGAYSLLRYGHLDRLHDWSGNLMTGFPWLPDGAAIRGEHLARLGRHQEALEAFVQLTDRGLPCFSDGLAATWERLRLYTSLEKEFRPDLIAAANDLHTRLAPFMTWTNFDRVVTTFTGRDLNKPDRGE